MDTSIQSFISPFLNEDLGQCVKSGRYRRVKGVQTGRTYTLRPGLLEAVAGRLYYQWAAYSGLNAVPVQYMPGSDCNRRFRRLSVVWDNPRMPCSESDSVRFAALNLFLDNGFGSSRLTGFRCLGLSAGIIALLIRYRLLHYNSLRPSVDLGRAIENIPIGRKMNFIREAIELAALEEDEVAERSAVPDEVAIDIFKQCTSNLDDGTISREVMKLLLKDGPGFLHKFTVMYIKARQVEFTRQLGHIQLA